MQKRGSPSGGDNGGLHHRQRTSRDAPSANKRLAKGAKDLRTFDEYQTEQLLPAMAKMVLKLELENREMKCAAYDVYKMSTAHKIPTAMKEMLKDYSFESKTLKEQGQAGTQGSPHIQAWAAMVTTMAEDSASGGRNQAILNDYIKSENFQLPVAVNHEIRHCRLNVCQKDSECIIELNVTRSPPPLQAAVASALEQQGAERLHVKSPRCGFARQIQALLDERGD